MAENPVTHQKIHNGSDFETTEKFRDILADASFSTCATPRPTYDKSAARHSDPASAPPLEPISFSKQHSSQMLLQEPSHRSATHAAIAGSAAEPAFPAAHRLPQQDVTEGRPQAEASDYVASTGQADPGLCMPTGVMRGAHLVTEAQPPPMVVTAPTADEGLRWEQPPLRPNTGHRDQAAPGSAESPQPQRNAGEVFSATMDRLLGVWTKPRVKSDWSLATWHADEGVAEVNVDDCKFLSRMGYTKGRRRLLYIEEALYLVARCDLVLAVPDASVKATGRLSAIRPLSVQECYELLFRSGFSVEAFQLYCHLSRAGYLVFRDEQHPPPKERRGLSSTAAASQSVLSSQERPAALLKRLQSKMPNLKPMDRTHIDTTAASPHEVIFNVFKPNSKFARSKQVVPDYRVALAREKLPSTEALEAADQLWDNVPLLYAVVNTGDVDYFNLCAHTTPLTWKT